MATDPPTPRSLRLCRLLGLPPQADSEAKGKVERLAESATNSAAKVVVWDYSRNFDLTM